MKLKLFLKIATTVSVFILSTEIFASERFECRINSENNVSNLLYYGLPRHGMERLDDDVDYIFEKTKFTIVYSYGSPFRILITDTETGTYAYTNIKIDSINTVALNIPNRNQMMVRCNVNKAN